MAGVLSRRSACLGTLLLFLSEPENWQPSVLLGFLSRCVRVTCRLLFDGGAGDERQSSREWERERGPSNQGQPELWHPSPAWQASSSFSPHYPDWRKEGRPSNALKLLLSHVLISLRCWELSLLPPRCVLFNEGRGRRGECGAQGLGMLLTLQESPVRVCLSTSASAQPWCTYMNVYVWWCAFFLSVLSCWHFLPVWCRYLMCSYASPAWVRRAGSWQRQAGVRGRAREGGWERERAREEVCFILYCGPVAN